MNESIFAETEFFLLIVFSLILPVGIYGYMLRKKAIARWIVLLFGVILLTISGASIFYLQILGEMAKRTPSTIDDSVFASEVSIALYLLPALFAGIGVNLISHVLISHITDAERRSRSER